MDTEMNFVRVGTHPQLFRMSTRSRPVLPRWLCLGALMFAGLALVAVLTVVRRSDPPSAQTSIASGAPESLDASALPEIHAEPVASTQVPWNPQRDWEPGPDVVISEEGELFVSQEQDWRILVIDEAGDIVRTIGRRGVAPPLLPRYRSSGHSSTRSTPSSSRATPRM